VGDDVKRAKRDHPESCGRPEHYSHGLPRSLCWGCATDKKLARAVAAERRRARAPLIRALGEVMRLARWPNAETYERAHQIAHTAIRGHLKQAKRKPRAG
jgi:hypothetical protein